MKSEDSRYLECNQVRKTLHDEYNNPRFQIKSKFSQIFPSKLYILVVTPLQNKNKNQTNEECNITLPTPNHL